MSEESYYHGIKEVRKVKDLNELKKLLDLGWEIKKTLEETEVVPVFILGWKGEVKKEEKREDLSLDQELKQKINTLPWKAGPSGPFIAEDQLGVDEKPKKMFDWLKIQIANEGGRFRVFERTYTISKDGKTILKSAE